MVSTFRISAAAAALASVAITSVAASEYYAPATKCYGKGERCVGAKGYPAVDYYPCCDGLKEVTVDYDWGTFCGEPPKPVQCAGEEGYDYVPYVECKYDEGYYCGKPESYGSWYKFGKYCLPTGGDKVTKCYKDGERQIGEKGYEAVPWMPCCSGYDAVDKYDSYGKKVWGKFCPYKPEGKKDYYPEDKKDYPEVKKDYPEVKKDYPEVKKDYPEVKKDYPEVKKDYYPEYKKDYYYPDVKKDGVDKKDVIPMESPEKEDW